MIKLIVIFLSISFTTFLSIGASENEENFDCKNYNAAADSSNVTCCTYFDIYSDEIDDIALNKTLSYLTDNVEELSKSKNFRGLKYCIFENYLMETAGFSVEGKFDLEKFDSFVKDHAHLAAYAADVSNLAKKCVNLAVEIDVVKKQEEMTGIKVEQCNFEQKFISNCIDLHENAVRREI